MTETLNSILSGRSFVNTQTPSNKEGKEIISESDHTRKEENLKLIKEQRSLWRLNSVLASDQPLKDNVPRGYYLNITV